MTAGNLVISFKASPFPYAAVAIASYTQKAEVNYDELAKGLSFIIEGTEITTEEDTVKALAKAGGLAEDNDKVRTINSCEIYVYWSWLRPPYTLLWPNLLLEPRQYLRS